MRRKVTQEFNYQSGAYLLIQGLQRRVDQVVPLSIVTKYRLLQLRVALIRNNHDIRQHPVEVYATHVPLQSAEDAYLQDARFFDHHCGCIALSEPQLTMVKGRF
jgi:hypothetical protein